MSGKGGLFQLLLKKGRPFLNVRVFELYKYTSTIFDSFSLSLPNQAARHVDWRRKQERNQRTDEGWCCYMSGKGGLF